MFTILLASSLVAIDVPSQTYSGLNIYAGTFKGAVIGQDANGHPLSAGPYSVMANLHDILSTPAFSKSGHFIC